MLYSFVTGQRQLRLAWLLASSILIGYCLGTCTVQFNAMNRGMSPMGFLSVSPSSVAYALVLVLVSCMLLLFLGAIEKPLVRKSDIIDFNWRHERFLWAALGLILLAYIHGDMTLNGTVVSDTRISVLGGIAGPLSSIVAPLAFLGVIRCSGVVRIRAALITLCGLVVTIPQGRRPFIYALLLMGIVGSSMAGRRVRLSGVQKAALAAAGAVLVSVVSLFFIGLRIASYQIGADADHSITSVVRVANRTSFKTLNDTATALDENMQERPGGLITYLAQLTRGGDTPAPLLGKDLALGMELAVPQVFYRLEGSDKTEVASLGGEESLANESVGLPSDVDSANSLLSAGAVDFGVPGALIYPALWTIFVLVLIAVARSFLPRSVMPVLLIAILNQFLLAENPIGGYISDLRSIAMLGIIWALVYYIPIVRLQRNVVPSGYETDVTPAINRG